MEETTFKTTMIKTTRIKIGSFFLSDFPINLVSIIPPLISFLHSAPIPSI